MGKEISLPWVEMMTGRDYEGLSGVLIAFYFFI